MFKYPYPKFKRSKSCNIVYALSSNTNDGLSVVQEQNINTDEGSSSVVKNLSFTSNKSNIENIKLEISNKQINDLKVKMATTPLDIFNNLRIPDAIKDLPTFNGNPRLLYDFLNNVQEILDIIPNTDNNYLKFITRAIRNKIVCEANEVLNMYGTPVIWSEIRRNLILHYSDKRNETSLIRDLHVLKQSNETVENFYSKIIELFSTLTNFINIHETDVNVISAKHTLYQEMCLNTYLTGLKEPLGSTIRAMRPKSLAEAFSFSIQEQNTYYVRNTPKFNNTQNISHTPHNRTHNHPTPQNSSYRPFSQNFNNRSYNPNNYQSYNQSNNRSYNQNNYRSYIPNTQLNHSQQRLNSNANRPQQTQPFFNNRPIQQSQNPQQSRPMNHPTPMDTSSGNTNRYKPISHPNTQFFKSTGPFNFHSKELFKCENPEITDPDLENEYFEYEDDPDYPYINYQLDMSARNHYQNLDPPINDNFETNEIDEENFRKTASHQQSGS